MSNSILAVLLYCAWALALVGGIAILRTTFVVAKKRAPNAFAVAGDDVSPFSGRLCRAHANCYENLPIFAGIVLAAAVAGQGGVTDPLALWVVAARMGQSVTHLLSTSNSAVQIRFAFFLAQILVQGWWLVSLLGAWR